MPGLRRVWLAAATFCIAVSGVVVATESRAATAVPDTVLAPVAALGCPSVGAYAPPPQGSVGLPPGLRLCGSEAMTITSPGTVLDGWDIRGSVVVDAPDVVIRRTRVTGDGSAAYGVSTTDHGSVRVEDSTLTGRFGEAALGGARWTAERLEVVGVIGDGVHAGAGARLRASSLSRFASGRAIDGVEVRGADVVIEGVDVRMDPGHRSAIAVVPGESGPDQGRIEIRSDVLGGGEWTIFQPDSVDVMVVVQDNRFIRDAQVAPLRVPPSTAATGNTYTDGAAIPGA